MNKLPILLVIAFIVMFLTGCNGIAGMPISTFILFALVPALIFYLFSIAFIGLGLFIRKFILEKTILIKQEFYFSLCLGISLFIVLNCLLVLVDPDIASILFFLVTLCSIGIFLGGYNNHFWHNVLYLLVVTFILIILFALDVHGPLVLIKIFRTIRGL